MSYIVQSHDPIDLQLLGGKASALASLGRTNLPIPPWFVVAPEAFYASLPGEGREIESLAQDYEGIQRLLHNMHPNPSVQAAIADALPQICPNGQRVAVRSSFGDEDSKALSFAGQFDSHLFVPADQVVNKVAAVWRSSFSERINAYRYTHGRPLTSAIPAVLIQRMVCAEVSGVAFSADPVTGQRGVTVVVALHGLGTALVSGECDADTFHVSRDGKIIRRVIAYKCIAHRFDPTSISSIRSEALSGTQADQPALSDEQILAVADLARRASHHFNHPQDIEWAIEDGQLYLLQSRPITTLTTLADPDGQLLIWDNSNIVESYGGVTTPLTFSFASKAYEEVYRQFCRMMQVPDDTICDNASTFASMLGFIRGHVYYNLLSWYKVLALLPGFATNRRFMEQMMGVKEGIPDSILRKLSDTAHPNRFKDRLRLIRTFVGLISSYLTLESKKRAFSGRLSEALKTPHPALHDMRTDELAGYYRNLEQQLLTRWDAPLINDFFCMIFFGVLRRLMHAWCGDEDGSLSNDVLSGQGEILSVEPANRLAMLGRIASKHPEFVDTLAHGSLESIQLHLEQIPEFQQRYQEYIEIFGDRCLDELKLESATLHDDPLLLLRSVGSYAQHLCRSETPIGQSVELERRESAEKRAKAALSGNIVRRAVFSWVLKQTRARVRDRENMRFERTRLFGRVRRIFVEIGRRFYSLALLDDPRDIFYLETEEVLGFIEGTSTTKNLKGLVELRKAEFAEYHTSPAPDSRFQTHGIVNHGNTFVGSHTIAASQDGEQRKGIGCCPGVVRGRVCVISEPQAARLTAGDILVTERTDPGWIMLYPCAAGVVVERGSLLSHSAIVAREMRIPTVVSLAGATRWLKDGDWVEVDGGSGIVRRICVQEEASQ